MKMHRRILQRSAGRSSSHSHRVLEGGRGAKPTQGRAGAAVALPPLPGFCPQCQAVTCRRAKAGAGFLPLYGQFHGLVAAPCQTPRGAGAGGEGETKQRLFCTGRRWENPGRGGCWCYQGCHQPQQHRPNPGAPRGFGVPHQPWVAVRRVGPVNTPVVTTDTPQMGFSAGEVGDDPKAVPGLGGGNEAHKPPAAGEGDGGQTRSRSGAGSSARVSLPAGAAAPPPTATSQSLRSGRCCRDLLCSNTLS